MNGQSLLRISYWKPDRFLVCPARRLCIYPCDLTLKESFMWRAMEQSFSGVTLGRWGWVWAFQSLGLFSEEGFLHRCSPYPQSLQLDQLHSSQFSPVDSAVHFFKNKCSRLDYEWIGKSWKMIFFSSCLQFALNTSSLDFSWLKLLLDWSVFIHQFNFLLIFPAW